MGKILKRDRIQEFEEINQQIQRENFELRRLVQILEEDKREVVNNGVSNKRKTSWKNSFC
jgi:hypothetical protein